MDCVLLNEILWPTPKKNHSGSCVTSEFVARLDSCYQLKLVIGAVRAYTSKRHHLLASQISHVLNLNKYYRSKMDWYGFFPILLCTLYFYMTIFRALTKNEKLLNSKCLLKFLCTWIRFANKQVESSKWISTDILSWWLKKRSWMSISRPQYLS